MPNVTWQEPQVLVDLLAINLLAERNGMSLPGAKEVAFVSPWLSDVEILMRPGVWHQQLTVGATDGQYSLGSLMTDFNARGWLV
ncbi:MAG: hypothetical protein NTY23_12785, partial [Chloroflexi bacterium]|nr:hypothetical protein [Chloroflexota bacterium]